MNLLNKNSVVLARMIQNNIFHYIVVKGCFLKVLENNSNACLSPCSTYRQTNKRCRKRELLIGFWLFTTDDGFLSTANQILFVFSFFFFDLQFLQLVLWVQENDWSYVMLSLCLVITTTKMMNLMQFAIKKVEDHKY